MKRLFIASMLSLFAALAAHADDAHHRPLADGEVRKVDREAQKITLRHGPLPDLDMPKPMTMVYRVKDPSLLDKVEAGDKVKFAAENAAGVFTVTKIERAN